MKDHIRRLTPVFRTFHSRQALALLVCLLLAACSSTSRSIIPKSLQGQVDQNLSFSQIKESPDSHVGTLVLVGGEILSAKRLKDRTRLTILQLPLNDDQEPTSNRTKSEGRLLAFQTDFLDPATVPNGTRVTLIGKITGSQTERLDEMDYVYPTMIIQHLKVWEDAGESGYGYRPYYGYPYWGPYGGYYGGWYSPYPYGYWW